MDVLTAIASRASATKLLPPAPAGDDLDIILRAGARAAGPRTARALALCGARRRPGQILADAMAEAKRLAVPDSAKFELDAERSKAIRAPMIIAVAARLNLNHKVPEIEQILAVGAAARLWRHVEDREGCLRPDRQTGAGARPSQPDRCLCRGCRLRRQGAGGRPGRAYQPTLMRTVLPVIANLKH
ncbi:MAG: nitroreductase [Rhodospirillales bacterium]|nr:nitroreductase [Rhodospirillales bacterium]